MNLVENYNSVRKSTTSIKGLKKRYITNFFETEEVVSSWIDDKMLYIAAFNEVSLLFRKNSTFYNLYYVAATDKALEEGLKKVQKENPKIRFVSDIVTKNENPEVKTQFENSGFYEYTSLMRMNRMSQYKPESYESNRNAKVGDTNHGNQVYELLHTCFDPFSEQLPSKEKLLQWIENENLIVYMIGQRVAGFIIYELKGHSLHLKYWFVSPDCREQRIGSKLFELFLYKGYSSKRQIFWVVRSNENAIKRYKHYGFKEDRTYDFVMTNRI